MAFIFNNQWFLGKIISSNEEELQTDISLYQSLEKKNNYQYSDSVILNVPIPHILCDVIVSKNQDNTFKIKQEQVLKIIKLFNQYLNTLI